MAQGIGNILSVLFGGIPTTGAIARSIAGIKNGSKTPVSDFFVCCHVGGSDGGCGFIPGNHREEASGMFPVPVSPDVVHLFVDFL